MFAREGDWPKAKPARGVHALATRNVNIVVHTLYETGKRIVL